MRDGHVAPMDGAGHPPASCQLHLFAPAPVQRALGELSYESDAAERLRGELRGMQAEAHALRNELDAARVERLRLEQALAAAEASVAAAAAAAAEAREAEGRAAGEVVGLRAQLAEAQRRLSAVASDSGSMIDKRVVVKMVRGGHCLPTAHVLGPPRPGRRVRLARQLTQSSPPQLITYFERRHSPEVLDLMAGMLGFTEEEKARVTAAARKRRGGAVSLAADVAGGASSAGAGVGGGASLADAWLSFLEGEAEADGGGSTGGSGDAMAVPAAAQAAQPLAATEVAAETGVRAGTAVAPPPLSHPFLPLPPPALL